MDRLGLRLPLTKAEAPGKKEGRRSRMTTSWPSSKPPPGCVPPACAEGELTCAWIGWIRARRSGPCSRRSRCDEYSIRGEVCDDLASDFQLPSPERIVSSPVPPPEPGPRRDRLRRSHETAHQAGWFIPQRLRLDGTGCWPASPGSIDSAATGPARLDDDVPDLAGAESSP
jgi:hypothetical protein